MKIDSAWPNKAQLTLLKAALLPAEKAEPFWHEFIAAHDLQKLDHGCHQILPMVFINLKDRLKNDLDEKTCRSNYKYVWANNHLLMHDLKALLVLLEQNNLEVCLLKGAAFIGHYYPDYGMRIMGDIDLLVSPKQMPELINVIESNQYKICSNQSEVDTHNFLRLFHARSFENSRGTEFDIHQYISKFLVSQEFTERVWRNAKAIDVFGIKNSAYVLHPTYQLLHTTLHGLQYAPVSSIRWIVDAANLLANHCDDIDWEELCNVCAEYHLNLPMKMALSFLHKEFLLPIPRHTLTHFENVEITNRDNAYFISSSNLGFRYAITRIRRSWEHYKSYSSSGTKKINIIGFYDFLLLYLNIESRWMLLPHVVTKLITLFWRFVLRIIGRINSKVRADRL